MPTYEGLPGFLRDFDRLTPAQKLAFLRAVAAFVQDLRAGTGFRRGLRVRKMSGQEGVWELTWAPDGRATFEFGPPVREGHAHIVWRHVGSHDIFKQA